MPKVVHFEITAENPRRAIDFYENIFDWKISKWDGPQEYWLIDTGDDKENGISGGISKRQDEWNGVYNTVQIDSIDRFVDKVKNAGGTVVTPKSPIPGVGYIMYCKDTEGNMFGLLQPDPEAK